MQILIGNEQKAIKLNIKKIEALVKRISKILRIPSKSSLGITFISRARIRQLNRRYFRRDRVTDVIAFGYREAQTSYRIQKCASIKSYNRIIKSTHPVSRRRDGLHQGYVGDIVICPNVALENSKIYHNDFYKELLLYIIHGILHLQGYTDNTKHQKLKMQKKEREVLNAIAI